MGLFGAVNWLRSPADRDIIARWTVGAKVGGMRYSLALPPPPDPSHFTFLALGDTGDSEAAGPNISPQDAVGREMALDASLPDSVGAAQLVLHMGDLIYMTGERRLYDRNFRRPYAPFLTPESTVDNLVFRLPFLPVPGNHDYYDLGSWAVWLSRVPILGAGLRTILNELFAFNMPEGGSDMGRAYMQAFVDDRADTRTEDLPYRPGERTRLPNRYYRFRYGNADFFALDSNTLDAPLPSSIPQARSRAAKNAAALEKRAREIDSRLRHDQRLLDTWRTEQRERIAEDKTYQARLVETAGQVIEALAALEEALAPAVVEEVSSPKDGKGCRTTQNEAATTLRRWQEGAEDLSAADTSEEAVAALETLEEASDAGCGVLRASEGCLAGLPEGDLRTGILAARDALDRALALWSSRSTPLPLDLTARLRKLSEQALDVQRELALERRRARYRAEDYDTEQLRWLAESLNESIQERPDNWRIVTLHHPLYSSISNHCERPDVQDARDNLLALLKDRVHLVLAGHSHAFEWFRSSLLPTTGLFVTGGGGQISLRPSILEPTRFHRHPAQYESLRRNGAQECVIAGRGPSASDGASGLLYHYLRVEVTPDALFVRPVGVRRIGADYRREEPMPVFHVEELTEARPPYKPRRLAAVEIRRGQLPSVLWEE
jgi:hypothetical protein